MFKDYNKCLENSQNILNITAKVQECSTLRKFVITLSANDNRGPQMLDGLISYPNDTGGGRVCEAKLIE